MIKDLYRKERGAIEDRRIISLERSDSVSLYRVFLMLRGEIECGVDRDLRLRD